MLQTGQYPSPSTCKYSFLRWHSYKYEKMRFSYFLKISNHCLRGGKRFPECQVLHQLLRFLTTNISFHPCAFFSPHPFFAVSPFVCIVTGCFLSSSWAVCFHISSIRRVKSMVHDSISSFSLL